MKTKRTKKRVMETSAKRTIVTRGKTSEIRNDETIAKNVEMISYEWTSLNPSEKEMGVVKFYLDKGVSTTVVGTVYGLDFEINVKDCLDPSIRVITAMSEHIPQLAFIYRSVFETYPSPLTNPDYIKSTMDRNVTYKIAMQEGEAVAAASAEINKKYSNAEMTDCATIPKTRGKGVMQHILMAHEKDLKEMRIKTVYTLARAKSMSMNKVFFRLNYEYSGRLINNCDIFGNYEDMNIWVKKL